MVVLLYRENGLPHQCAHWFAMTDVFFPVSNHSEVFTKSDYHADFGSNQATRPEGILCVFRGACCAELGRKIRYSADKMISEYLCLKRERGECFIHPAVAPVSLIALFIPFVFSPTDLHLGGQNLAALCTAAGQNLTAVGSSHSLTETVNLGTVTLAGLIGTLHYITPPDEIFSYARQSN